MGYKRTGLLALLKSTKCFSFQLWDINAWVVQDLGLGNLVLAFNYGI